MSINYSEGAGQCQWMNRAAPSKDPAEAGSEGGLDGSGGGRLGHPELGLLAQLTALAPLAQGRRSGSAPQHQHDEEMAPFIGL